MFTHSIPGDVVTKFFRIRVKDEQNEKIYLKPNASAHKRLVYLDDDIVVNGLSALEAGKVDEVVEKISQVQDKELKVKVGSGKGSLSGGSASEEALEAEYVRRRTRFSIFESWYEALKPKGSFHQHKGRLNKGGKHKTSAMGIGKFNGWGETALKGVEPGDIVELKGTVEIVPLQTLLRSYLWFVDVVSKGRIQEFKRYKNTLDKNAEQTIKFLLGENDEINALFVPVGKKQGNPEVALTFLKRWCIGPIGRWFGNFTLVAQVEEVLNKEQTWQTMRIIEDVPMTPLEEQILDEAVENFRLSATEFGLEFPADISDITKIKGPALILRPIALFR